MRKALAALLLVCMVWALAGCGPGAEQILKDSMRASKEISTVHFEMQSTTKLPRAPITEGKVQPRNYVQKSSGEYDLRTGDFKVQTSIVGTTVTMLQVSQNQYWEFAGNWYQVPQAFQMNPPVTQALSVSQYVKYFTELKKLSDTKVQGEGCFHIEGVPDMKTLVKQPGITDLLKDPTGKQIRTVDELVETKAVFDFYIMKQNSYFKRSTATVESRAPNELIQLGFAQPGDKIKQEAIVTFSQYNKKLNLQAPQNVKPWPGAPPG